MEPSSEDLCEQYGPPPTEAEGIRWLNTLIKGLSRQPARGGSLGGDTQLKGRTPAKAGAVLAEAAHLPYNASILTPWAR
jgi:hypothetical protein